MKRVPVATFGAVAGSLDQGGFRNSCRCSWYSSVSANTIPLHHSIVIWFAPVSLNAIHGHGEQRCIDRRRVPCVLHLPFETFGRDVRVYTISTLSVPQLEHTRFPTFSRQLLPIQDGQLLAGIAFSGLPFQNGHFKLEPSLHRSYGPGIYARRETGRI